MQIVRSVNKTNDTLTTAVRNSSCSRGWLRLAVQCFFFAITVTSFILILILTLSTYWSNHSGRCQIQSCNVICYDAPFNGLYENEIIFAVAEAETNCQWVLLTLNRPIFQRATLPVRWLSRMRSNVHDIAIIGGNLRTISPLAFMTQFMGTTRSLVFEKVTLEGWTSNTLAGLSNLKELIVKDVNINDLGERALEAVDNTLEILRVTASGRWNPKYLTGTTNLDRLETVDLSFNLFDFVIGQESFTNLKECRVLFLNSCSIKNIGAGAFDNLFKLEMLHLNDNFLITVPNGLFKTIALNNQFRVQLQNNNWLCHCALTDLRQLSDNEMILIDPLCHLPEEVQGQSFREFYDLCPNETAINDNQKYNKNTNYDYIHVNGSCDTEEYNRSSLKIISPIETYSCPLIKFRGLDVNVLTNLMEILEPDVVGNFLKPTIIVRFENYSMFEIRVSHLNQDFGILWYQSRCPHEVYCINVLPNFLRIYDFAKNSVYTFCPLELSTGIILSDKCISYSTADRNSFRYLSWTVFYIITSIVSLSLGALCVYLIIRKFPSLLRGSKRILFVKHKKNINVLVLPPKINLRTKENEEIAPDFNNAYKSNPHRSTFIRTKSVKSTKSNAPSYISALQPTEDQLAEWRLRNHFSDGIASISSYITNDNSLYCSLDQFNTSTIGYDSLK